MQTIKIPTFWSAEEADLVDQFLGELQAVIWQQYHHDIEQMYDEVRKEQARHEDPDGFDDEIEF